MLNLIDEEVYFDISDAVLQKDFKVVFQTSQKIFENGWDFIDFLEGLIEHFRNILSAEITGAANAIESAEIFKSRYLEYKSNFSESDLLRILNFLNKSQQELRFSQNHKLKIEILLSHLIALEGSKTITEIISRVNTSDFENKNFSEPLSNSYPSSASPSKKKDEKPVKSFKSAESVIEKVSLDKTNREEAQVAEANFNFDDLVNKWKSFIESIRPEKGFALVPALLNMNLATMERNNLHFVSSNKEDLNTFRINEKYLSKKSEEYFGRKFNFILNEKSISAEAVKKSQDRKETREIATEDPYESLILKELGGEKIA
jgi:DNA polymerase-3 subunit gamma/tau